MQGRNRLHMNAKEIQTDGNVTEWNGKIAKSETEARQSGKGQEKKLKRPRQGRAELNTAC